MINDVHHHTSIFIPCPTTSIDSINFYRFYAFPSGPSKLQAPAGRMAFLAPLPPKRRRPCGCCKGRWSVPTTRT